MISRFARGFSKHPYCYETFLKTQKPVIRSGGVKAERSLRAVSEWYVFCMDNCREICYYDKDPIPCGCCDSKDRETARNMSS